MTPANRAISTSTSQPAPPCPLCLGSHVAWQHSTAIARYTCCAHCGLVFMHPDDRMPLEAERAHYTLHNNSSTDPGYRRFLSKLTAPLTAELAPDAKGLDFGSGPGPTLSVMLAEQGFEMNIYDPAFASDTTVLDKQYDFITCTETAEHFHQPRVEFDRLNRMLRPPGCLALMTEILQPDQPFATWWYHREPTHVCFYQPRTLHWLAAQHHWRLDMPHPNVALFRK